MDELRDRIAAALGEEPAQQETLAETPATRFTRPAVGVAIAASVAVMALFTLQQVYAPDVGVAENRRTGCCYRARQPDCGRSAKR